MDNMAMNEFSWGTNILQAWVYFRESINSPDGMESWQVLYDFYGGLDDLGRQYVDTIFLGETFNMDPLEVLNYLDYLVETTPCLTPNFEYNFQNSPMEQSKLDVAQEKTFSETMLELGETMLEFGEKFGERVKRMQASIDKMCIDLNIDPNDTLINEISPIHDSPLLVDTHSEPIREDIPLSQDEINFELERFLFDIPPRETIFNECNVNKIDNFENNSLIQNIMEPTQEVNVLSPSNPTTHPIVDTELSREHMYLKQAELDRLWLENENLELDELERLIFNPETLDSKNEDIIEFDQCINNELFYSSDLVISSHNDGGEIENKTSIDEFAHKLEIITPTCDKDTEKIVTNPPKKFFIDFIIPDFYVKTDRTIVLIYFLQFSFYSNKFLWRYCGQRKSKYWLGNFPYWVKFGSVEFMPLKTMVHAGKKLMDGSSLFGISNPFLSIIIFIFTILTMRT